VERGIVVSGIYKSPSGGADILERYEQLLDQWPVNAERLRLPTAAGETFVVASGDPGAPPLLLLQGSGANAAMWLPAVARLSGEYRTYAVDLIGEPGLSAPGRPPFTSDAYARWLDDVLRGLGVSRTSILAVSLGGWVALDYAIRRPEAVERLALLTPAGLGRRRSGFLVKAALLSLFGERGRRRVLGMVAGGQASSPTPYDHMIGDLALLIFRHFRPRMGPIPSFTADDLRRLDLPVLVVAGGRDVMLDSHDTARRVAEIPAATMRLLPEAGHLLPDQTAVVLDFLGQR
jgi:pimeloyl-ACP methyl ester carboxylesterase